MRFLVAGWATGVLWSLILLPIPVCAQSDDYNQGYQNGYNQTSPPPADPGSAYGSAYYAGKEDADEDDEHDECVEQATAALQSAKSAWYSIHGYDQTPASDEFKEQEEAIERCPS